MDATVVDRWFNQLLTPLAETSGIPLVVIHLALFLGVGVLGNIVIRILMRRLNRAADQTLNRWDDVAVYSISKPLQWAMWVILIYWGLGIFDLLQSFRNVLLHAADTGTVILTGWFLHRLVRGTELEMLGEHRGPKDSDDRAAITAAAQLAKIALWMAVGLMLLQTLGVSVSSLLAFGGIGGIAVGFAAKDLLANFLGGVSIYLDRPFAVGDWIRSPDRDIEGTVEHIGWRMTRIRTFDQRPLYVPNAVFSTVSLENPSRMLNRRIYENIGIRYGDFHVMEKIVAEVKAMLLDHPDIETDSRVLIVNFNAYNASSIDFMVYTFTKTINWVEFHSVKQDVLMKIMNIIEGHGAEVAFPTRTLMFDGPEPELLQSLTKSS